MKKILAQLDETPMLGKEFIQLALWMRERYFCTVYDAARIMLPAGLWFSLKDCIKIAPGVDREAAFLAAGNSGNAKHLVELLFANQGSAEVGQIRLAFGTSDPGSAIRFLTEKGIIQRETSAKRGVNDKTEQVASLAVSPEDAMASVSAKQHRAPLQYSVVETLCAVGEATTKELCYFTGASIATLKSLQKAGIVALERRECYRRPVLHTDIEAVPVELNAEQAAAYDGLTSLCSKSEAEVALLHGVTGSGKTLVYVKLIQFLRKQGKSVIILVPEIALTPQLVQRFTSYFGDDVALLHRSLGAGERYDEWKRVRDGKANVVIGTRSAVFAPVTNLGAIILDEEQESSYKSEQSPRYHAREVARYRTAKSKALLLLGSATPTIETMYRAKSGYYRLFEMKNRFNAKELPQVEIVDMKLELREGNGSSISKKLESELRDTIERGEQAILFLNRRGANRMVTCGECGHIPECPRCSTSLTYHSANHRLMCHYCGHSEPIMENCPKCGGILNFVGTGTQKAEEELKERFPGVEILRMDADTVSLSNSHEVILEKFRKKKISILLGTQMVAKGLDFENVTLVGVLAADQSLYTTDYRAGERTFSLLTQVVGRAGRGNKSGRAVIQTYTPDNDVIQTAAKQDYASFYEQELCMRNVRERPPFGDLLMIGASGTEELAVLQSCAKLRDAIQHAMEQPLYSGYAYRLLGPAPASIAKVNNRYRYHLILNINNTKEVRQLIAHLLRSALSDRLNKNVSFYADFDPQED